MAGEHTVLRGGQALVFPLPTRHIHLMYHSGPQALTLELRGSHGSELEVLVWSLIDRALSRVNQDRSAVSGKLQIASSLPVGAGLGASAALSVAVTRWLIHLRLLKPEKEFEFALDLENLFHGESSGVDIAVVSKGKPLIFRRGEKAQEFKCLWNPPLYLTYSGEKGLTSLCVQKVKTLLAQDPKLGERLDLEMKASVSLAIEALSQEPSRGGMQQLTEAIRRAGVVFQAWGLVPLSMSKELVNLGAAAVKPTGSGGGGYFLSLWPEQGPPTRLEEFGWIQCFSESPELVASL